MAPVMPVLRRLRMLLSSPLRLFRYSPSFLRIVSSTSSLSLSAPPPAASSSKSRRKTLLTLIRSASPLDTWTAVDWIQRESRQATTNPIVNTLWLNRLLLNTIALIQGNPYEREKFERVWIVYSYMRMHKTPISQEAGILLLRLCNRATQRHLNGDPRQPPRLSEGFELYEVLRSFYRSSGHPIADPVADLYALYMQAGADNITSPRTTPPIPSSSPSSARNVVRGQTGYLHPRVSIICPTSYERHNYHGLLLHNFNRQTYPNKQLLVFDSGYAPSALLIEAAKSDYRILYRHSTKNRTELTLGAKRNWMVDHCDGAIIVHFDDDDYYGDGYVSKMVSHLSTAEAPALVKLTSWLQMDVFRTTAATAMGAKGAGAKGSTPLSGRPTALYRLGVWDLSSFKSMCTGWGWSWAYSKDLSVQAHARYAPCNFGEEDLLAFQLARCYGDRAISLVHDGFLESSQATVEDWTTAPAPAAATTAISTDPFFLANPPFLSAMHFDVGQGAQYLNWSYQGRTFRNIEEYRLQANRQQKLYRPFPFSCPTSNLPSSSSSASAPTMLRLTDLDKALGPGTLQHLQATHPLFADLKVLHPLK